MNVLKLHACASKLMLAQSTWRLCSLNCNAVGESGTVPDVDTTVCVQDARQRRPSSSVAGMNRGVCVFRAW